MILDPFYRKIEESLSLSLNPDLFERCACDLINDDSWHVAPIPGGDDLGMDGAVADGDGVPFPLVCTISNDVIGNLTRNLQRHLKETSGPNRKAILATSRQLTTRKRKNLEARAAELGFTLVDCYDRPKLARLLYRSPLWCHDLLGLTGAPPALSVFPRNIRHSFDIPLIGRDDDLQWLIDTGGDRLIVGQPGSGKTFLLSAYIHEHSGVFIIDPDIDAIAAAFREQQPAVLVVDDAFQQQELITALRHFRKTAYADFDIVATCWPGDRDAVANALTIPSSHICTLSPLIREQMAEIVRHAGIAGPDELIGEILNQSQGMPGLAVTLARLCLQGDWQKVVRGETLLRQHIKGDLVRLLGNDATVTLAAFALGGAAGMSLAGVAHGMERSAYELRNEIDQLAAGGILCEGDEYLFIRSEALQCVLVREVFFCGPRSMPCTRLLDRIPSVDATTKTLIRIRLQGGSVPDELLWKMVQQCRRDEIWKNYCLLGQEYVANVLETHPEKLLTIAPYAIHIAPDLIIPRLLDAAVTDKREPHANPDQPMRILKDWVESAEPDNDKMVPYRRSLLQAVEIWAETSPHIHITVQAIAYVVSPEYDERRTDPITRRSIRFHFGVGTPEELRAIEGLWEKCLNLLRRLNIPNWQPLFDAINDWLYSTGKFGKVVETDEVYAIKQDVGKRMLLDLAILAGDHPGVHSQLAFYARVFKVDIPLQVERDYEMLFGGRYPVDDLKAFQAQQDILIRESAKQWHADGPVLSVKRFERLRGAYSAVGDSGPCRSDLFFKAIASLTDSPDEWLDVIMNSSARMDMAPAFMWRLNELRPNGWEAYIQRGLEDDKTRRTCICISLLMPGIPIDLLGQASTFHDHVADILPTSCYEREPLPLSTMRFLLCHQESTVAVAAAIAEWHAKPEGDIRADLAAEWQAAILRGDGRLSSFFDILAQHPTMLARWFVIQLRERTELPYLEGSQLQHAVDSLDDAGRKLVIDELPRDLQYGDLARYVVGRDPEMYRYLLRRTELDVFHMKPLLGRPNEQWVTMARDALDAGYEPRVIAFATFAQVFIEGKESVFWKGWEPAFQSLLTHDDIRVRDIGRIGLDAITHYRDKASKEERLRDVY